MEGRYKPNEALILLGKYSKAVITNYRLKELPRIREKYRHKIDMEWNDFIQNYTCINEDDNSEYFFTSFSPNKINVGMKFHHIFKYGDESSIRECNAEMVAFINEHILLPISYVDEGHRSICLIKFEVIPTYIEEMNAIDKFTGEYDNPVGLF